MFRSWSALAVFIGVAVGTACSQPPTPIPTAADVEALLIKEPITDKSWPIWKDRLTSWFGDKSRQTDAGYKAAQRFVREKAGAQPSLPPPYDADHLAWYFLGSSFLDDQPLTPDSLPHAETAYERAIKLKPGFARGHRNLAIALMAQVKPAAKPNELSNILDPNPNLKRAQKELDEADRLDPNLQLAGFRGMLFQRRGMFPAAIAKFQDALNQEPENSHWAVMIAQCALVDTQVRFPAAQVAPLAARFPNDGVLATYYSLCLAAENRNSEARAQLQKARTLGVNPALILPPNALNHIENTPDHPTGPRDWIDWYLLTMKWFGIVYVGLIVLMAASGAVLAFLTRGTRALDLLKQQPADGLVREGLVARVASENLLARLYGIALMLGLILFYIAIPFVIVGLLGGTGILLYYMFQASRISVRAVALVVIVGGLSAWAVFKSLFSKPATGGFGILKSPSQCPRLHDLLAEVAETVNTDRVDEVYLSPGAAIGVHQEGRGPFGMFGVSKRVLTLGFCTLRFLTVGELKAILAHEYAHFSHSDTFYSRFIYQVHISISEAIFGMQGAGGIFSYANPFYWFLWLYYKSYSLLSAGYSRSREFLADRMAASLFGPAQFGSALRKVSTDGALFEMTIYENISSLLQQQQQFVNMYDAFAHFRNEQMTQEERDKLQTDLHAEQGSLFASHPTFNERIEAIAQLPDPDAKDDRPALELFDEVRELEEELTKFLTDYMAYLQILAQQAAQEQ